MEVENVNNFVKLYIEIFTQFINRKMKWKFLHFYTLQRAKFVAVLIKKINIAQTAIFICIILFSRQPTDLSSGEDCPTPQPPMKYYSSIKMVNTVLKLVEKTKFVLLNYRQFSYYPHKQNIL